MTSDVIIGVRGFVNTYNNHIEFLSIQFGVLTFELSANGVHLFRWDSLIGDSEIVLINHTLADIHT